MVVLQLILLSMVSMWWRGPEIMTHPLSLIEPVTNPQVTVNGKYIGERVPVSVEAQGRYNYYYNNSLRVSYLSTPIGVEWSLYFNGSTMQCEQNATILNSAQSDTFYCTFNNSGDYNINVTFKNTVSYESANKPFTMSQRK